MSILLVVAIFGPIMTMIIGFKEGVKLARTFHSEERANLKYALQHQYERLRAGTDADDPLGPYTPPAQVINADFGRKLKTNRRATMWLNKKGA